MPAIMSFGPGNVTGIDLQSNAFWRLTLDGVTAEEMGIVVIYPPSGTHDPRMPYPRIALARMPVSIATNKEEIDSVARASLVSGTLDGDIQRATEAMNLFKMHARTKEAAFVQALENALALVRTYWQIRTWLENPVDAVTFDIGAYKVQCRP